jgi:hypothetical protein
MMPAAVVLVCVDHRLNHELIRIQVRQRLDRAGLVADQVYVLTEVAGNPGQTFTDTLGLLNRISDPVVFCAVLHHDDCVAAREGLRLELPSAVKRVQEELARAKVPCPVATGVIQTEHNWVHWSDEPVVQYRPFTFGPGW